MAEQENMQTVQEAYAAFGRGDIQGVLNTVADNVDWFMSGPTDIIPFAGQYKGRDQVAQFFAKLGEAEEVERFEPREFIAQGDKVIALGNYRGRIKSTGRINDIDWVHVFTLRDGKIVGFRQNYDTAATVETYRATSAQAAQATK